MSINNLNTYLNVRDAHLRVVSGNVYAQAMNIGGINVETAHGLQSVSDTGNVTSNTLQFSNATTGFVTTANAQIGRDLVVTGNATVSTDLTVSANATVTDTLTISEHLIASKEATVTGNLHVTTIRSDSNVVAEYTGPHDRPLRKYPEVGFPTQANGDIGNTTVTYKGYTLTSSTTYNYINHNLTNALDGLTNTTWSGNLGNYTTAGVPQSTTRGGLGDYVQLELPNAIKIQHTKIFSQETAGYSNGPRDITLYGSNNGTDWTSIKVATDLPLNGEALNTTIYVNSITFYRYFRLEINKIWIDSGNATYPRIAEWELYGYEEGSGSLDTTLKTVYNVPATTGTQLEVYYDAKGESTVQSPIPDLSPNTNTGAVSGHSPTLDSTGGIDSFKFNGSSQYVTGAHGLTTGSDPVHTISLWLNAVETTDLDYVVQLGQGGTSHQQSAIIFKDNKISHAHWGSGVLSDVIIATNVWYHVVAVFTGGNGSDLSKHKIFINGEDGGIGPFPGSSDGAVVLTGTQVTLGRNNYHGGSPGNYFNGSIANFRVYSKALNADQVKELYDYQKDYFLGSKSQVTLYKGHLGVGVTEPSGQLELVGDERIQEYPPRAMTGYETLMEGHGVFCASASSYYNATSHLPWQAFTPAATSGAPDGWNSGDNSTGVNLGYYAETASGEATSAAALFEGTRGEWVQLKCPYPIIVKKFAITGRSNNTYAGSPEDQPKSGILYGSNDGNNWDVLANFLGLTYGGASGGAGATGGTEIVEVNATKGYTRLVLQATARVTNYGTDDWINIGQLQYFGTPGPTTLDKGSLSLTRSLDVPRVSRYDVDTETPRPEKLVLDYDTTVNSSPTDISGNAVHGTFFNGATYDDNGKAFSFNNTQGGIRAQTTNFDTSGKHSFVAWMKFYSFGHWYGLYGLGTKDGSASNFTIYTGAGGSLGATDGFRLESRGGGRYDDRVWSESQKTNKWYHVAVTWDGTGGLSNVDMYIDLVKLARGGANASATSSITLPTDRAVRIGADAREFHGAGAGSNFNGLISNPKFYSEVLEFSEIKKLYNLGRTGRSMVISDTAVGIGKAPEAQLDVRGNINYDGVIKSKNPIAFAVYRDYINNNSRNHSYTGNALFNTVHYNYGGHFDIGDSKFIVPVKGLYHFGFSAYTNQSAGTQSRLKIMVDPVDGGSTTYLEQKGFTIQMHGNSINTNAYCDAGDKIWLSGNGTSQRLYMYTQNGHNRFYGYLIYAL